MNAYHTVPEVARALRVGPAKVRTLIKRGELAGVNVGAGRKRPRVIISADSLQSFITRRSVIPETPALKPRPKPRPPLMRFD